MILVCHKSFENEMDEWMDEKLKKQETRPKAPIFRKLVSEILEKVEMVEPEGVGMLIRFQLLKAGFWYYWVCIHGEKPKGKTH